MIAAPFAALLAAGAVALGEHTNRRWLGFLPDDVPRSARKQHHRPVPLAGVLLLPAVAPWLVASAAWWPLVALTTATVLGFVDDRGKETGRELGWRSKAVGLAVASAAGAAAVASPTLEPEAFALATLLVFVLANAINFLDNMNGVAAALTAVIALALAQRIGGPPWLASVGFAALGFLPFNWPSARVFLGDAGAYLFGVAVGIGAAGAARHEPSALWCTAVPLADFVQVVIARTALGVPPWVGDRRHLTHIVHHLGAPRAAVAPLFAALAWLLTRIR